MTKVRATTSPTTAKGRRRKRLRSSRRRRARPVRSIVTAGSTALTGEPPGGRSYGLARDADARIEDRVHDVHRQVDDDVAGGGDEDDALQERVVALADRVDRQPPEARDDEDLLRDHRAGD